MTKCRLCGDVTIFEATKLCSRCWELEHRIVSDFEIAIRIISETLNTERELLTKQPCGCSGPCDEEGLVVEHQCNRCKRLVVLEKLCNTI